MPYPPPPLYGRCSPFVLLSFTTYFRNSLQYWQEILTRNKAFLEIHLTIATVFQTIARSRGVGPRRHMSLPFCYRCVCKFTIHLFWCLTFQDPGSAPVSDFWWDTYRSPQSQRSPDRVLLFKLVIITISITLLWICIIPHLFSFTTSSGWGEGGGGVVCIHYQIPHHIKLSQSVMPHALHTSPFKVDMIAKVYY